LLGLNAGGLPAGFGVKVWHDVVTPAGGAIRRITRSWAAPELGSIQAATRSISARFATPARVAEKNRAADREELHEPRSREVMESRGDRRATSRS